MKTVQVLRPGPAEFDFETYTLKLVTSMFPNSKSEHYFHDYYCKQVYMNGSDGERLTNAQLYGDDPLLDDFEDLTLCVPELVPSETTTGIRSSTREPNEAFTVQHDRALTTQPPSRLVYSSAGPRLHHARCRRHTTPWP
jgi:hypothetical protein